MALATSSSSSSTNATINVTPLIDVLLVLLIIFMVIVPIAPRGLESVLPDHASSVQKQPAPPLVVEVVPAPATGAPQRVMYRVAGRVLELPALRRVMREAVSRTPGAAVLIGGDPRLEYRPVAVAVAEAHQAGYLSVGLLTKGR